MPIGNYWSPKTEWFKLKISISINFIQWNHKFAAFNFMLLKTESIYQRIIVINHRRKKNFTSSNCSHGVAISSTDILDQSYHACGKPIDPTYMDILIHCTVDTMCYRKPICLKTHHTSPTSLSDDLTPVSGQTTRLSGHYNLSFHYTYWIYPKFLQPTKTNSFISQIEVN